MPGQTITVTSTAELQAAYATLASQPDGGTILVAQGVEPVEISLKDSPQSASSVTIKSADTGAPTQASIIHFSDVSNVTVEGFHISSIGTTRAAHLEDLSIDSSENITIKDVVFEGSATEKYDPDDPSTNLAATMSDIRNTTDITFSNNTVSGYYQGLVFKESKDINVLDNEIFELQGDGIRLAGVERVTIDGNHLHDFHGTTYDFNHNDMIQLWSRNVDTVSQDITISNNLLISGDGASSQSIFLGNEASDTDPTHIFKNITISDNVIYNGQGHGITAYFSDNVLIDNNTVLWNPEATVQANNSTAENSTPPRIFLDNVTNAQVRDNITSDIVTNTTTVQTGNKIIEYFDKTSDSYIENHFVNAFEGGGVSLEELTLRADSPWANVGAADSQPVLNAPSVEPIILHSTSGEDLYEVTLDAGLSVGPSGQLPSADYTYTWAFSDGTVKTGMKVSHSFDEAGEKSATLTIEKDGVVQATEVRSFTLESKVFADFDFTKGLEDASDYETALSSLAAGQYVQGEGVHISAGKNLSLDRSNDHIHSLESFSLSFDMKVTTDGDTGRFLHFANVMEASIKEDQTVSFRLITSDGSYTLNSSGPIYADGDLHNMTVTYEDGQLSLSFDGQEAASISASGQTAPPSHYHLTFGTSWGEGVNAVVSTVDFTSDKASLAGETQSASETAPTTPPVVETPPATDPTAETNGGTEVPDPDPVVDTTPAPPAPAPTPDPEPQIEPELQTEKPTAPETDTTPEPAPAPTPTPEPASVTQPTPAPTSAPETPQEGTLPTSDQSSLSGQVRDQFFKFLKDNGSVQTQSAASEPRPMPPADDDLFSLLKATKSEDEIAPVDQLEDEDDLANMLV